LVRGERLVQFKQYTDTAKILDATVPHTMSVSPNERHGSACESAMKHGSEDMPIACRLTTEELRVRDATLLAQFRSAVVSTEDLADGYAFRIPGDAK
jgi:hypothetical protein